MDGLQLLRHRAQRHAAQAFGSVGRGGRGVQPFGFGRRRRLPALCGGLAQTLAHLGGHAVELQPQAALAQQPLGGAGVDLRLGRQRGPAQQACQHQGTHPPQQTRRNRPCAPSQRQHLVCLPVARVVAQRACRAPPA